MLHISAIRIACRVQCWKVSLRNIGTSTSSMLSQEYVVLDFETTGNNADLEREPLEFDIERAHVRVFV
jgi:hypothetical protein